MGCSDWARAGSWAAEEILKRAGVVTKALDPLDPVDFVAISSRLARALRGAAVGLEGEALRSAIEMLDVDWPNISEARRDKIIEAARAEVLGLSTTIAPLVEPVIARSATSLVPLTRKLSISRYGLSLASAAEWSEPLIENLRDSQMVYVKDQYAQRADSFDSLARSVVGSGLERGLGRDDISEELAKKLTPLGVERGEAYWNLIATDFANKSRTTSQLSTFDEAGIEEYRFEAILDQETSEICRFLQGRIFSVKKARKRSLKALALRDPEEIKNFMPWIQQSGDQLYFRSGGKKHDVATIDEPGGGVSDKLGTYSGAMSRAALERSGVAIPPRHGHCRSTLIALV